MIILSKISIESGQEYLDATIVDSKMIVEIDNQYDEVISQVGESVEIDTVEVIRECDISSFSVGNSIRIVYREVDGENNKLKNVYAIYLSSEL